jgi:ribulose-bisphosphate carboxylase small chain
MRVTAGQFSYLPDLTDEQITKQVQYALDNGWAVSVEYTADPHPRNSYWELYGIPMFDIKDAAGVMDTVRKAIAEHKHEYVKVLAFDARRGRQTTAMSFIVNRPAHEPGFRLERTVGKDRQISYKTHAYATDVPEEARYRE